MTTKMRSNASIVGIGALVGLWAAPVFPQEAAEAEASRGPIEEIVVTARYRDESIQDIGASITALGGEDFLKRGIDDLGDLAGNIAGLDNRKSGPNTNEITIRGLSNAPGLNAVGLQSSSLFVISLDDVSITSATQGQRDIPAFDLDRVEILRGPQPTLFGEGAVGGVIRYFSTDPDLDGPGMTGTLHGRIETIKDGGSAYRVENATSLILAPGKLGVRLMGFHRDDDGFIDNPTARVEDANDFRTDGGRAVLLARPNDDLEVRFSAMVADDDYGDINNIDPTRRPRDLIYSIPAIVGVGNDDIELYSGRMTYDFGPVTATSVTGLYKRDIYIAAYEGGNTVALRAFFPTIDTTLFRVASYVEDALSQELRFVSDLAGSFNFTAGFLYGDRDFMRSSILTGDAYVAVTSPPGPVIFDNTITSQTKEYSGFFEATFDVTDRFRVIAGVRYLDQARTSVLNSDRTIRLVPGQFTETNPITFIDSAQVLIDAGFGSSFNFDLEEFLPRGGFEFDLNDDVMLYANIAKGVRNGFLNVPIAAYTSSEGDPDRFVEALQVGGDSVVSADWGAKTRWLDGNLIANVSLFYAEYDDAQINVTRPTNLYVNGPKQRLMGLEFESALRPNDSFTTFVNFSLLDAEVSENFSAVDLSSLGVQYDIPKGNAPANAPHFSFSTGYDVRFPLRSDSLHLVSNATIQHVSERYSGIQNLPASLLEPYTDLRFRIGVENERYSLFAFVSNALNQISEQAIGASGSASNAFINAEGQLDGVRSTVRINRPRTFGIDLTVRY